jgi:hypothetical protein
LELPTDQKIWIVGMRAEEAPDGRGWQGDHANVGAQQPVEQGALPNGGRDAKIGEQKRTRMPKGSRPLFRSSDYLETGVILPREVEPGRILKELIPQPTSVIEQNSHRHGAPSPWETASRAGSSRSVSTAAAASLARFRVQGRKLNRMIEVSPIRASCWKPGLSGIVLEERRPASSGQCLAGCEEILCCSSSMLV